MVVVPIEVPVVGFGAEVVTKMLVPLDIYRDILVKVIEKIF
jgi:hypothetical protein